MKYFLGLIFLFLSSSLFAQDTIITKVNDTLLVYIQSVGKEELRYSIPPKTRNPKIYKISMTVVKVIKFEEKAYGGRSSSSLEEEDRIGSKAKPKKREEGPYKVSCNSIYGEVGPVGPFSFGYERSFRTKGMVMFNLGLVLGTYVVGAGAKLHFTINLGIKKSKHHIEVGANAVVYSLWDFSFASIGMSGGDFINAVGGGLIVGYRMHSQNGLLFRGFINPTVVRDPVNAGNLMLLPLLGVSLGKTF